MNLFECRLGDVRHASFAFSHPKLGVFGFIAPGTPRSLARVGTRVMTWPPGYYFGLSIFGLSIPTERRR